MDDLSEAEFRFEHFLMRLLDAPPPIDDIDIPIQKEQKRPRKRKLSEKKTKEKPKATKSKKTTDLLSSKQGKPLPSFIDLSRSVIRSKLSTTSQSQPRVSGIPVPVGDNVAVGNRSMIVESNSGSPPPTIAFVPSQYLEPEIQYSYSEQRSDTDSEIEVIYSSKNGVMVNNENIKVRNKENNVEPNQPCASASEGISTATTEANKVALSKNKKLLNEKRIKDLEKVKAIFGILQTSTSISCHVTKEEIKSFEDKKRTAQQIQKKLKKYIDIVLHGADALQSILYDLKSETCS